MEPDFAAIRTDGSLWTWGDNSFGQLGDGTLTARPAPVRITTATNWKTVAVGGSHTVALKTDGSLWAWGSNSNGQLGNNSLASRTTPIRIGTSTWKAIAAGYAHTVAIRSDGSLWAWGDNSSGQLGDNTLIERHVPTRIGTGVAWATITAGYDFTLGTLTDHTLWSWGGNVFGQLGDGTIGEHHAPRKVGLATTWATVAAGNGHVLATRTNGTLWAWGDNREGELGDGTTTDEIAPVQIGVASQRGPAFPPADRTAPPVGATARMWAWGNNDLGQLGDGTTTRRLTPTQAGVATDWTRPAAGLDTTLAVRTGGTLSVWGDNAGGLLGIPIGQRATPGLVSATGPWKSASLSGARRRGTRRRHVVGVGQQRVGSARQRHPRRASRTGADRIRRTSGRR